jgi:cytochrome c biogenesis protein CcmG/thiol:disulfide interchange protein DsbE
MSRAPALCLLVAALAAAGCGSSAGGAVPSRAAARRALAGAPAPLASLHVQAGDVLAGGAVAFHRRLAGLRGHAVVVNKWASWCAPCRSEFPVLARVSVDLGKRVAFLGLDARDSRAAAHAFLARHPLAYPSYADPKERIAATIEAPEGFPITNLYDRAGKLVYQHAGPYTSDRALEADLRRYASVGT